MAVTVALPLIFSFLVLPNSGHVLNDYRKRIALESARLRGSPEFRIIGGENASIEEYPFAVSLQNNGTFFGHEVEHFCGGSIINEKWIITSAQCALRMQIKRFHVRAGTKDYYKNGRIYDVTSATIHPKFNPANYDYDIALVKLSGKISFDETKQPIKLPKKNIKIPDGTLLNVIGWGTKELLGIISDDIRQTKIPKISNDECIDIYNGLYIPRQMFCVFLNGIGPCVGDSGSPAILNNTLIGIASWREACTYEYPTAYANVAEMIDWITEVTGIL